MKRHLRRGPIAAREVRALVLVALSAALAAVPSVASSAGAPATVPVAMAGWTAGACPTSTGVTVVVDFAAFDGRVVVRCVAGAVSSGFDALRQAGFKDTQTQRFPGLLCRIDGLPADQECVNAPPASAHWGYWHAPRGGQWTYSSHGAGARVPPEGTVEGWAFGAGVEPGIAPPAAPPSTTTAPPPPPPPTTAPASPPPTGAPADGPAGSGSNAAPTRHPGTDEPVAGPDDEPPPVSATRAGDAVANDRVEARSPRRRDELAGLPATPTSASRDDGGSPAGLLAATGLAGLFALSASIRRRRARAGGEVT